MRAATELLRERLLERGVEYIVSVIAASNSAAIAGVKNGGFKQLGHGWWEHAEYGRYWCEVWILNLRDSGLDASLAGSGDSSAQG